MALQRAVLHREQQENAQVANALLDFGREIAPAASEADALDKACEIVARTLGTPRTYVVLDDPDSGDVVVGAAFGVDESALELRFRTDVMREILGHGTDSFALSAEDVADALGRAGIAMTREPAPLAVAPLALSGNRVGCILAAAPGPDHEFTELDLRLLAGMAHQAALLIRG
jgi:GAF domain-containing protein